MQISKDLNKKKAKIRMKKIDFKCCCCGCSIYIEDDKDERICEECTSCPDYFEGPCFQIIEDRKSNGLCSMKHFNSQGYDTSEWTKVKFPTIKSQKLARKKKRK